MTVQIGSSAARATSIDPCCVNEARFVSMDSVLDLRFEDGLERAVHWADLPFARRLGIAPVAASVGLGKESVTLVDQTGVEMDVSGESLRAALDEEYRARLLSADDDERRIVGARLRTVRESLGEPVGVSRRSGIAQESLSRIEMGRRDPRLGTLRRLARGMGLSLDQLMERLSVAP